jgi:hypothetical protein
MTYKRVEVIRGCMLKLFSGMAIILIVIIVIADGVEYLEDLHTRNRSGATFHCSWE